MAAIDDLISQIQDESLRERIRAELKRANKQKRFGLVYEEHIPESTPLYDVPVKKGSVVAQKGGEITDLLYVESIADGQAVCLRKSDKARVTLPVNTLVSVAQFGEPIYPYLQPLDTVCNAPDSDLWHALIEADNYHALQLLEYLYAEKVDCIYIDPPYNTGARDWKYNNDYVDGNDEYRHSKWLSMMEKRLRLAQRLLNPEDSVLIVTIDQKEYLHLGCIIEEIFKDARTIQMISSVINSSGSDRQDEFSRTNEYLFIIMFGKAQPVPMNLPEEWYGNIKTDKGKKGLYWNQLMRSGSSPLRINHPLTFYPLYVSEDGLRIVKVGEPLPPGEDRHNVPAIQGTRVVWPIRSNGDEGRWQLGREKFIEAYRKGYVRLGKFTNKGMAITYLAKGEQEKIENGKISIIGKREDGSVIESTDSYEHEFIPSTSWDIPSHNATYFGSQLINKILCGSRFNFPKSIYAVHDVIRFFEARKPNALIIDFFAGSGTTLHAVNLLNAEDGGHRRCILVTNNEVSADEAKTLTAQGYQPGDPEWECLGIAHYVTWPRTVCSIEGHDVNGQPLKGNYLGGDPENPRAMAEGFAANAAFFKLGFLDKTDVALGRQFRELLPVLWLKADAHGPCPRLEGETIPDMLVLPENHFAVLTDEAQFEAFAEQVNREDAIETVYIVTDSEPGYRDMITGLKAAHTFQLYRDYLDNFRINHGGR